MSVCLIKANNSTAMCWILSLGFLATSINLLLVVVVVNRDVPIIGLVGSQCAGFLLYRYWYSLPRKPILLMI